MPRAATWVEQSQKLPITVATSALSSTSVMLPLLSKSIVLKIPSSLASSGKVMSSVITSASTPFYHPFNKPALASALVTLPSSFVSKKPIA